VRVLEDLGAAHVVVISRTGNDNYGNLSAHYDAQIVVNATPVGMYPKAGEAAVDITRFTQCRAVFDLIYNPLRTKLMLDAREAGIPAFGGLHMLTAQAVKAFERFRREGVCPAEDPGPDWDPDEVVRRACRQLRQGMENIVLIGMPGCGKTTIGRQIGEITGKPFVDCDEEITRVCGRTPEEIIAEDGTRRFREIETSVILQVLRARPADSGGIVFAAGGGCVEREENRVPLLENSLVIYLQRDLEKLATAGRPVSLKDGVETVFERRRDRYESWSDIQCRI